MFKFFEKERRIIVFGLAPTTRLTGSVRRRWWSGEELKKDWDDDEIKLNLVIRYPWIESFVYETLAYKNKSREGLRGSNGCCPCNEEEVESPPPPICVLSILSFNFSPHFRYFCIFLSAISPPHSPRLVSISFLLSGTLLFQFHFAFDFFLFHYVRCRLESFVRSFEYVSEFVMCFCFFFL